MTQSEPDDQYPPEEAGRRRDEALRRALSMPPKPQASAKLGKPRRKVGKGISPDQKEGKQRS